MAFDVAEFEKEVDSAIDASEALGAGEAEEGSGNAGGEKDGDKSDDSAVSGESSVDDGAGEEGSPEAAEGDSGDDKGSAEGEGDQEGDGDSGEESTVTGVTDLAIEQAVRVGLSVTEARSFASDESLLRIVDARQQAQREAGSTGQVAEAKETEAGDMEDLISKIPNLDPEEFQPEVIAMFDALKDIVTKQQEKIQGFAEQQSASEESRYTQTAAELEGWFDREVEGLGSDFVESLGKGGLSSLQEAGPQFAKRVEIAEQIEVLLGGYTASGRQAPPREKVFEMAARTVLGSEFRQQADKKITSSLKKRETQHIQRGSGKKADEQVSPEDEIARELDEKYPVTR